MKRSSTGHSSSKSEVASLRKEVASLKKAIARMQRTVTKLSAPGKLRATKIVVDALEVVDANGKVVASIDNKGNLFCLTVFASTGKNTRGIFLDGKTFRKVSAASLELIGPTGNTPGLEATSLPAGGAIKLRGLQSKQVLQLQGHGAPLMAFDATAGTAAVVISTNSPAGGSIDMRGTTTGSRAVAKLSVSHLTGAGALFLTDSQGNPVGTLP